MSPGYQFSPSSSSDNGYPNDAMCNLNNGEAYHNHDDILKSVLQFLACQPVPSTLERHCDPAVLSALQILAQVCQSVPRIETFIGLLRKKWPIVFAWIAWIASHSQHGCSEVTLASRCLFEIMTLDRPLKEAMLRSKEVPKAIISLWIKGEAAVDGLVVRDYESMIRCPNLSLAYESLTNRGLIDGDTVRHAILSLSEKRVAILGARTTRKVRRLIQLHAEGRLETRSSLFYLMGVLDVTKCFLQGSRRHEAILARGGLIGAAFEGLKELTKDEDRPSTWELVVDCFKRLYPLIFLAEPCTSNPISLLAQAVAKGCHLTLFRSLLHLDPRGSSFTHVLNVIGEFGPYVVVPEIAGMLWATFSELENLTSLAEQRSSAAGRICRGFCIVLGRGAAAYTDSYSETVRSRICDYMDCSTASPGTADTMAIVPTTTAKTRQCSACRSVIYCSRACQRSDWKEYHRQECPVLTHSRKRYDLGLWIPFSLKSVYLGFLEDSCHAHAIGIREKASFEYPDIALHRLVTMFNFMSVPARLKTRTFNEYEAVRAPVPSHLKLRIDAYVQDCRTNSAHTLIEMTFSHGLVKVSIVARTKAFPDSCKIISAIFSFCVPSRSADGTVHILKEVPEISSAF